MNKSVSIILVFSSILMPIIILCVTGSFATFGIAVIVLLLLIGTTAAINGWKEYPLYNTLLFTYCIYTLFAILHYYQIVNNELDSSADEVHYFIPFVDKLLAQNISFNRLVTESLQYNFYGEHYGYLIYIGCFALIGEYCLGDYNVMQLLLSSVLLGCSYSIILFKTIAIYQSKAKAYKYTIFYMLCTPIVMSSFVILRDLFVALLFLIGIYIVLKNKSFIKGMFVLIISFLILTSLRLEHALFFALIIVIFIYQKLSRYKVLSISLFAISAFLFFAVIQNTISTMSDTLSTYNDFTKDHANNVGLAMKLLSLPTPIKEIACTLFSQIFPIPPWASLLEGVKSFPDFIFSILSMIKTVCWFYIAFCVVKWYCKYNTKIKKYNLNLLLLATMLLIVACSSEYYESRRMMCMYPIIYITFILLKNKLTSKQRKRTNSQFITLYSSLLLIYYIIL